MPPWGNRLNDAQIWDLAAYVWNLSLPPEDIAAGEQIYREQCAACHGDDGAGNTSNAPAEMIDLTDLAVMTQRSQADLQAGFSAGVAHDALTGLPETELRQALDYIRTFTFKLPQRNGVLNGQILNATTNRPQGNLEVTLFVFEGDLPSHETFTTQADENGRYSFENLPTDHSVMYVVEGSYEGVSYLSEPTPFTPNSAEATVNLNVYETTTSAEAVSLSRLNYLVAFEPDKLSVIQLFVLSNSGAQTYIGQEGQTFSFTLPQAAIDITFQGDAGNFVKETGQGYVTTEPVLPGEEGLIIAATYNLPYQGDALSVAVPIPANVASVNILMQDLGATLSSEQLQFVETREVQDGKFSIYSGSNLPKDSSLTLELTGLNNLDFAATNIPPGATVVPANAVDQNMLRWVVIGLGGAVIVFVGIFYPRFRARLTSAVASEDVAARRQKLLLLLARLDDAFEAGELDEQVYRRARTKYKSELAGIIRESI